MPTDDELARHPETAAAIAGRIAEDPQIANLRKRRDQLTARLERLTAIRTTRERKRRTRRLILLGTYLEHFMDRDPEQAHIIMRRMNDWLTRPADRRVFGLDPLPDPD